MTDKNLETLAGVAAWTAILAFMVACLAALVASWPRVLEYLS